MQKIIFSLLAIFSIISLKAEETAKEEYMCKLNRFQHCQAQVGLCIRPLTGLEEWEKALACANDYKECIDAGYSTCENKQE